MLRNRRELIRKAIACSISRVSTLLLKRTKYKLSCSITKARAITKDLQVFSRGRFTVLPDRQTRSDLNSCKSMNKPWQRRNNGIARYTPATCETSGIFHVKEKDRGGPKDEFLKRCTPPCHAPPERPPGEFILSRRFIVPTRAIISQLFYDLAVN